MDKDTEPTGESPGPLQREQLWVGQCFPGPGGMNLPELPKQTDQVHKMS